MFFYIFLLDMKLVFCDINIFSIRITLSISCSIPSYTRYPHTPFHGRPLQLYADDLGTPFLYLYNSIENIYNYTWSSGHSSRRALTKWLVGPSLTQCRGGGGAFMRILVVVPSCWLGWRRGCKYLIMITEINENSRIYKNEGNQ